MLCSFIFALGSTLSKDTNEGTTAPPRTTDAPSNNRYITSDTSKGDLVKIFSILAGTGIASAFLSGIWMFVMKAFPKQLIYIALVFNVLMYFGISIASFIFGQVCYCVAIDNTLRSGPE